MTTSIFAKQALTAHGWLDNVTIGIDDHGRISELTTDPLKTAESTVDILLPALSNVHSHSFQRAMAGLAEKRVEDNGSVLDDFWSWRKVMYRFLQLLCPDDVEAIAALVQMEMLESGYAASAEFHYLHHAPNGVHYDQIDELSERLFQASLTTGIGFTHLPVLYMRGGLNGEPLQDEQLRFACNLDEFQNLYSVLRRRLRDMPEDYRLGVAPHSLRAVSKEGIELLANLHSSAPLHIHIAEQTKEVDDVINALGARPVQWLLDNFAVDRRWCLIHSTHMNHQETCDLAASGAVVGLCPITEANLGDGIFNAKHYFEQNGQYGIGADSNVKISVSEELRLLEISQRLRDRRRVVLSDRTTKSNGRYLYSRAAIGGAQALGRRSGKIEVGAFADLVALDGNHYSIAELDDDAILDTWIFACNDDIVSEVWAAGRHQVRAGKHINRERIINDFNTTMRRLRQAI